MSDNLMQRLHEARPEPPSPTWSRSTEGAHVLDAVLHHAARTPPGNPQRNRGWLVAGGTVSMTLVAVAALSVLGTEPSTTTEFMCYRTASQNSDGAQLPGRYGDDPVQACTLAWSFLWPGSPQPAKLVECVTAPGAGLVAVPAPTRRSTAAEVCGSMGALTRAVPGGS